MLLYIFRVLENNIDEIDVTFSRPKNIQIAMLLYIFRVLENNIDITKKNK